MQVVTRAALIQEARTWIGTRYMDGQRTKGVGVDCLGLVLAVAKDMGCGDFDCQEFRAAQWRKDIVQQLESFCGPQVEQAPGTI